VRFDTALDAGQAGSAAGIRAPATVVGDLASGTALAVHHYRYQRR
jgi:hypothetical protein